MSMLPNSVMLERIKMLLQNQVEKSNDSSDDRDEAIAATTALLFEAAIMDGQFDQVERTTIERLLTNYFNLNSDEFKKIIYTIENTLENPNKVFSASQTVIKSLDYNERVSVMEMVWEVILSDGKIHDFESNLARRIAGLIHVKDQHNGAAKKRVLDRINT